MKQDMSRRAFLGLDAMTAAVAGAGLAGCAPSSNSEKAADGAAAASAGGDVMAFEPSFLTGSGSTERGQGREGLRRRCRGATVSPAPQQQRPRQKKAPKSSSSKSRPRTTTPSYPWRATSASSALRSEEPGHRVGSKGRHRQRADEGHGILSSNPKFLGYWYDHSGRRL